MSVAVRGFIVSDPTFKKCKTGNTLVQFSMKTYAGTHSDDKTKGSVIYWVKAFVARKDANNTLRKLRKRMICNFTGEISADGKNFMADNAELVGPYDLDETVTATESFKHFGAMSNYVEATLGCAKATSSAFDYSSDDFANWGDYCDCEG